MQFILHTQKLLSLAFQHPLHRDAGPLGNNLGNVFRSNRLRDNRILYRCLTLSQFIDPLLSLGHLTVSDFRYPAIVACTLGIMSLDLIVLDLLALGLQVGKYTLLLIPSLAKFVALRNQFAEFIHYPVGLERCAFTLYRLALDLKLPYPAVELRNRLRYRIHLQTELGRSLIHEVDGLVGKKSARDISVRQLHRSYQGIILDTHLMMILIPLLEATHYRNGSRRGRLIHCNHLETALQSLVRLEILLILVQGSRADSPEFSTRERRLKDIGRIHRARRPSSTHQRMDFINEQDDLSVTVHNLLHYTFEPFLEFALIFRTCDERTKVERIYLTVLQILRNISVNNLLSDTLRYSRLSDTWFSHQNRIILCSPAKDLQYSSYLLVPADNRIELSLRCPLIKIDSEPAQIFKLVFCHDHFLLKLILVRFPSKPD